MTARVADLSHDADPGGIVKCPQARVRNASILADISGGQCTASRDLQRQLELPNRVAGESPTDEPGQKTRHSYPRRPPVVLAAHADSCQRGPADACWLSQDQRQQPGP